MTPATAPTIDPELPMPINSQRLLNRFLSYVQVDTRPRRPAGLSQFVRPVGARSAAGRGAAALGLTDARQIEFGIVMATVPATKCRPRSSDRRNCAELASRYFARDDRGRRPAAGDSQLFGGRHGAARRPAASDSRGRESVIGRAARPDDHHHRRYHAAWEPTTRRAWP